MIEIAPLILLGIAAYWFLVLRPGRLGFWRLVAKHPDAAYDHFKSNACWKVFEDGLPPNYRSIVPRSEWVGPFRLVVPKLGDKPIKVFGRASELEKSQNDLINKVAHFK
jgi:hypothetical protein